MFLLSLFILISTANIIPSLNNWTLDGYIFKCNDNDIDEPSIKYLSFEIFANVSSSPNSIQMNLIFNNHNYQIETELSYLKYHKYRYKVKTFHKNKLIISAQTNGSIIRFQTFFCNLGLTPLK